MKVAIYSGREEVEDEMWQMFDYIKIGPYIEERGPLENPNTNQKLFKIDRKNNQKIDITHLFWRKSQEDKNRIK
jgi:anaerobic ribonucleoside-triphosphate reductase activating protein